MANKENKSPALPQMSSISPGNKPALSRQRDHSGCRCPETPLRVRKTRDNLKLCSIYADIPPPCLHLHDQDTHPLSSNVIPSIDEPILAPHHPRSAETASYDLVRIHRSRKDDVPQSKLPSRQLPAQDTMPQRQRSVKQRMLTRVKQGLANRTKPIQAFRPGEPETTILRRLSGRRMKGSEAHSRAQSFEISRESIDSQIDESFESEAGPISVNRSFSESSVATADVLGDSSIANDTRAPSSFTSDTPRYDDSGLHARTPSPRSSPSPQPTPRPPRANPPALSYVRRPRTIQIAVPCIDLDVQIDMTTLDIKANLEMWVAIKATISPYHSAVTVDGDSSESNGWPTEYYPLRCDKEIAEARSKPVCGSITSLKFCWKPMGGCRIGAIIGQRSLKDLTVGQDALLFIKLHVPKLRVPDSAIDTDTDSLFTDLESMVGTLETEVLYVEARYRNSMLPSHNILTVRHVCTLKRPRMESRWSLITSSDVPDNSTSVHTRIAEYLAAHYASDQALTLMRTYLDTAILKQPRISELYSVLATTELQDANRGIDNGKPSVIVTDMDEVSTAHDTDAPDHFRTAPSTPITDIPQSPSSLSATKHTRMPSSISLPLTSKLAPQLLSAPTTTTALSKLASPPTELPESRDTTLSDSHDTARQLWRHIRRTSLSTKQLEEIVPARVEHLEAGDDTLRELRRKALANKRSVGAETLKDWKWEENAQQRSLPPEAPWM